MMSRRNRMRLSVFSAAVLIGLACGTTTPDAGEVSDAVTGTLTAYTVEAALAAAGAAGGETGLPPAENAPNPLPVTHTGVIINIGECFDFDSGQVGYPEQTCDLYVPSAGLLRQMNGTQISGYASMEPPTRSSCASARYETGDIAAQSDLYMCFSTNSGAIGFVVVRQDILWSERVVVDYWVFE